MSAVLSPGVCQGCGTELPAPAGTGRPRKWCSDRCRKAQYAGVCESCGGPTNGTSPGQGVARICAECLRWDGRSIIDAICRWADAHGGIPPTTKQWHYASVDHPSYTTVTKRLGWNEALLRAGFGLHKDRRPETQAWVERELRAGRSPLEIADRLGVTRAAIYQRLRVRGLSTRDLRNGRSS